MDEKKVKNKKSPIESIMLMLDVIRWCHIPSKIMTEAVVDRNSQYGPKYLNILYAGGYITKDKVSDRRSAHHITKRGRELLEEYEALLLIFKELSKD